MCKLKTTSIELNKIWTELKSIFINYKGMTSRTIQQLQNIGFSIHKSSNHTKIIMPVGVMVVSNTPSDKNAGRQILRQIRRMYEQKN
jgi:hypothetical protein